MATTANFTKFVYASDLSKYTSYESKTNNDITFVGGSSSATTSPTQNTSGIWAQGVFFPTPYAASDLYTKTQIDNQLTSIKTDVGACVKYTDIGKAGGVAGLDINKKVPTDNLPDSLVYTGSDGKISASVLPSYVDDVKEIGSILNTTPTVYGGGDYTVTKASEIVCTPAGKLIAYNAVSGYFKSWTSTDPLLTMEAYGTSTTSGVTPATDKIYVTLNDNRVYRYSGSVLVEISSGALSDAEASTLLNQYIKTITNGTVTPVYNAAEIEVVTGAGTKTNSTSKEGAIQTLTKSKAATKTYVDRMSPEVTIEDPVDADSNVADYVYNVGYTEGSILQQKKIEVDFGTFRKLTLQVNGTTKTTYTPNAALTINLTTGDFVGWTIL